MRLMLVSLGFSVEASRVMSEGEFWRITHECCTT